MRKLQAFLSVLINQSLYRIKMSFSSGKYLSFLKNMGNYKEIFKLKKNTQRFNVCFILFFNLMMIKMSVVRI